MRKRDRVIAVGAVVAAGAGYITGLLTAPKSGKETRQGVKSTADKARSESEKQLKSLHSELNDLIADTEAYGKKVKNDPGKELNQAVTKAKKAKDKARLVLSALHDGGTEDPNLQAALDEVKLARTNLAKFLKKK